VMLTPGLNPVEATEDGTGKSYQFFKEGSIIAKMITVFDATRSSKRHYDHVNKLDGITFGMGHWHTSRILKFFNDLHAHKEAREALNRRMAEFFSMPGNEDMRADFLKAGGETELTTATAQAVIAKTFRNPKWMSKWSKRRSLYQLPWVRNSFKYFLRDSSIVAWQIDFWRRDVVGKGIDFALKSNALTFQAVASFTSIASSAPGWGSSLVRQVLKDGKVSTGGKTWYWNKSSLTGDSLQEWRAVVVWQYYCRKKNKIRSRMRKLWNEHYTLSLYSISSKDTARFCSKLQSNVLKMPMQVYTKEYLESLKG